ncbi:DUF2865 domain-containing protein [Rhodopseudomonas palustris]|uniref:DUF2865 domain-containing protein n=1 Tax=Rhodopseudomonas palustris TaxID=1076 RepID=UPI002ACD42EC|nr:DUF2865 domain-containing protein [Rhodopseudomonas palustris]WQG99662.1 DUF2865 domain-containing protein [Rhodopseudomonas palustris]
MRRSTAKAIGICGVAMMSLAGTASSAQAQDFFSALFHGFQPPARHYVPERAFPFASEGDYAPRARRPARTYSSGGQAFCVRTCDGRYFPIAATGGESKDATCNSFCPASETKVVYGSDIDGARTSNGKPYSELPNAFKYRNEIVAGCTCNGKDQFGLAKIKIEDDPTVRKGDIVASEDGLKVAGRPDRREGALNYSPAPASIRAGYGKVPVVAAN